jgi:hypothetical protein
MTAPDRIQITHRPRTMTTPDIRTASERLLQHIDDPIRISSATMASAIAALRAALKAEPEGEGPSEADLYDLAEMFNGDPVPAMRRALELWGNPPASEAPAEALAARPLLERVAQLGDVIGRQTVAQVQQLTEQAAVWLRENPPGQPVAIEPRGCPIPGACSCVEPTPPAPEPGEGPSVEQMYYWALKSIRQYGSDTLSEQVGDREWLRAAVAEIVRRAQESLDYGTPVAPSAPEPGEVEA